MTQQHPAGWYDDGSGRQRWYDGQSWTEQTRIPPTFDGAPPAAPPGYGQPTTQWPTGFAPGAPAAPPSRGLAIAALTTGIVAFLTGLAPIWGILAGGTAIVLGVLALRSRQPQGMAITGIALGALALLASALTTLGLATSPSTLPAQSAAGVHTPPSSAKASAAPSSTPEPTPTQSSQAPETSAPVTFQMPNLVGANLQNAQDQLQALGSWQLDQQDASGQGRIQVLDSNWKVCSQEPAAGSTISTSTTVVLSSVKNDESCPGDEDEAPDDPGYSMSQEQAIDKATEYLDYTAFSKKGLIAQLKFEGFSKADATFAVEHINVDWNKQAELKAQEYLDYTSFSRSGLIHQLEFEGFTHKQAVHGVKAVGL